MSSDDRLTRDDAALELLRLAGRRDRAPAEVQARVHAAVRDHWRRRVARGKTSRWAAAAAALAAAATLVVVVVVPRSAPDSPTTNVARVEVLRGEIGWKHQGATLALGPGAAVPEATTLSTGLTGRVALRLGDGSSLRFDHETRVRLLTPTHLELDTGALYVDSGPNPHGEGLLVTSSFGDVRDVGTQFEVRLRSDALQIQVREGTVRVRGGPGSHEVPAGERALLAADGSLTRSPLDPSAPDWSWVLEVAPPFGLEGATAATYLEWVARETGLELQWMPPPLARKAQEMTLHGDISAVRPDATLDLVLPTCGLTHRRDHGKLVVGGSLTQ